MITRLFGALLCALVVPATAWAQAYPDAHITLVVPFAAGGPDRRGGAHARPRDDARRSARRW